MIALTDDTNKTQLAKSLTELAAAANVSHELVNEHGQKTVAYAREAGAALATAKARLGHGQWLPWLSANCPSIHPRKAQRYMQIHREWPTIAANATRATHLDDADSIPIRQALELVHEPRVPGAPRGPRVGPWREWPEEERRKWRNSSWGWEEIPSQTLLLTAMDWSVEKIADLLFVDPEDVLAILNPVYPVRFDTEWNGRGIVRSEHVERVAAGYRATTELKVVRCLWARLWTLLRCEWEEIPTDVEAELRGIHRHLHRRMKALEAQEILAKPVLRDPIDNRALWVMAWYDAQAALRIERVQCPGEMSVWFADVREEISNKT